MLEKFNEHEIEYIEHCALLMHKVHTGTATQQDLYTLFYVNAKNCHITFGDPYAVGLYSAVMHWVINKFNFEHPYIPFAISDLLEEAYISAVNKGMAVSENV